jgi:hypothetical protein
MIGDEIERVLECWGVTPERYLLAKSWLLRLRPNDVNCNCQERKQFLNDLQARFLAWLGAQDGISHE